MKVKANAYASAIHALCQKESFSEALSLLNEMGEQGLNLDHAICGTLIHGFHQAGKMDEATRFFKSMVNFGWVDDTTSLNDIVKTHVSEQGCQDANNLMKL